MNNSLMTKSQLNKWIHKYPLIKDVIEKKEILWCNPNYNTFESAQSGISLSEKDINDAEERLTRFAPFLYKVFTDTQRDNGIIESPLVYVQKLQDIFQKELDWKISGKILFKCDNQLAVSGSIKARGGIYEVLKHSEDLAFKHSLIMKESDYSVFKSDSFKNFFSQYSIAVGSTGNLGLSIGIVGVQLGFKVFVHMSSDAKQWKKDLLRRKGVTVIEHKSDYSQAVCEGRKQAESDPNVYFIDDENSTDLFLGYAVAAFRLHKQLENLKINIDDEHPLFVYLPCGVGGGPGGITFGLKQIYKNNVHCFFAEPTASPSMLLGLMTQQHSNIDIHDFGLDNKTDADGLAVASPSAFVGKMMDQMIAGVYTVKDEMLYKLLNLVYKAEDIQLEPSALAGMPGPYMLLNSTEGKTFLDNYGLNKYMDNATHIIWATGGGMVPRQEMQSYIKKHKVLKSENIKLNTNLN